MLNKIRIKYVLRINNDENEGEKRPSFIVRRRQVRKKVWDSLVQDHVRSDRRKTEDVANPCSFVGRLDLWKVKITVIVILEV